MSDCLHCGTPNPNPTARFCCSGCEFVYETLTAEGLDRFYDLKGKATGIPVKDRPFQPQDLDWLEKATDGKTTLEVAVNGVTCIGCVWLIEKLFLQLEGARTCALFPDTGQATFSWDEGTHPLQTLAEELPRYGYALGALDSSKKTASESSRLLARLGITSAFALNAMAFTLPRYLGMEPTFAFAQIFEIVTLLSATFALLIGGTYFFTRALAALRQRTLHIDLPISLGLLLAFAGSLIGYFIGEERLLYFDFVAIFTTLMLGGRYLHLAASEKARSNLTRTSALPENITLLETDGTTSEKPTRSLSSGEVFLLPTGQPLPVTAILQKDAASLSLAWINGEPEPRQFEAGQRVPSGAVNLANQALTLQADEDFADSLVAKLTQSSDRTQSSALLQKLLRIYLLTVLVVGVAGGLGWLFVTGSLVDALQVSISIFIVSCPCALGVAIPLADRRAATHLQTYGVFVQNSALWQRLMQIKALVLDKTGTLTLEHPTLKDPELLDLLTASERGVLLHLTATSLHPLSRTLHQHLAKAGTTLPFDTAVVDTPGQGLTTTIEGVEYRLGKPALWEAGKATGPEVEFTRDGQAIARFHFSESARPDAARALAASGLPVHILSGDEGQRVRDLARSLQLDPALAHGDLSPEDKATHIHELNPALFLGDGANDSLAFDAALATGSPVADRSLLDTKADFLFTQPGLGFLPHLLATSRWRHRIVRRVLIFAIVYNSIAITICLMGHMNPLLAAILMPLSSLASLALASARLGKTRSSSSKPAPTSIKALTLPVQS
ncbi:heavy metal translocating P-type ATPase [Roseibacillus persicicus]|uniref:Copper-translocating P-type ATPase n=1 Tax=Roseibacillus persicicus TaxID=454148 RepID=A0A918TGE8_9BACT|nr:heavy metal translocating P-type ATPase metal-binding domain-containing protein [Roseibacillus persicicus]GHC46948.1 copper-translocating P-type ATPase [Roseibacillus persicicus]